MQLKFEPAHLFQGPGFVVFSKPAGWCALEDDGQAEAGEDPGAALCSGRVEPLRRHPALAKERQWTTFIAPGAIASGWALLVDPDHDKTRHKLSTLLSDRHVVSYSLALVEGAPKIGSTAAAAHRDDGAFEVSALAVYERFSVSNWCGEATAEYFTLVLIKASGSAIGGERALLRLAWLHPALGDAENGCERTEQWFGGRPCIHSMILAMADAWWADSGSAVVLCPLQDDLRRALGMLRSVESIDGEGVLSAGGDPADPGNAISVRLGASRAERLRQVLWVTGCLPADLMANLGLGGPVSEAPEMHQVMLLPPDPAPFGHHSWGVEMGRRQWVVEFMRQALEGADLYHLPIESDGWLPLQVLLFRFAILREASFGGPGFLATAIAADRSQNLIIDGNHNNKNGRFYVRLLPPSERLQSFVEKHTSRLPPGATVSVTELLENAFVRRLFSGKGLPQKPLLACLSPCSLFVIDQDVSVLTMRSLPDRLRLGVEELMATPEGLLRKKLRNEKWVPLSWFLPFHCQRLFGCDQPLELQDAAAIISASSAVSIDMSTFSIRRCAGATGPIGEHRMATMYESKMRSQKHLDNGIRGHCSWAKTRTVKMLRSLLKFYFEPFNVQHNRMLLFSAEEGGWVWPVRRLAGELPRIEQALAPLSRSGRYFLFEQIFLEPLEHVRLVSRLSDSQLCLELTYQPDFRMPVIAPHAAAWVPQHFLWQSEHLGYAMPPEGTVVLSYSLDVTEGMELAAAAAAAPNEGSRIARDRWRNKIFRVISSPVADIVCLQLVEADVASPACSCDARSALGASRPEDAAESHTSICTRKASTPAGFELTLWDSLLAKLMPEDFGWAVAPCSSSAASGPGVGFVNAVFWRRSKWRAAEWSAGPKGALHVVLESLKGRPWSLSVCCMSSGDAADLAAQLGALRDQGGIASPAVLCGCFGTSVSHVPDTLSQASFQGFRSAHGDVLGAELPWTCRSSLGSRCTDGLWVKGGSQFSAVAALGGHSKNPEGAFDNSVHRRAFPTDHIPLVVALEYARSSGRFVSLPQQAMCAAGA